MRREDAAAVAALGDELDRPARPEDLVRRLGRLAREPGHAAFVAEEDGEVLGWAHVQAVVNLAAESFAEVRALVVTARRRRRGIGQALVRACEAWATDAGLERVRLRSGVHRDGAHAFYRRIGYVQAKASYAFERTFEAAPPAVAPARARIAVAIGPFEPAERERWEALARGYKHFYETQIPDDEYERAWQRLREGTVQGLGARLEGRLVGIAHYLYHASAWADRVCYLQDLFVDPDARGHGVARALIEAVAERARSEGASRYYWLTQRHNLVARALYDKVAAHRGFIRYDFPLEGG